MENRVALVPILLLLFACAIDHNSMLRQSLAINDLEMAALAIRGGADINSRDENGMAILHHKAIRADFRNIDFLLRNGADPNVRDSFGNTPIFLLISRQAGDSVDIYNSVGMLISNGADMSLRYRNGATLLHSAASLGLADLCEMFVALNYISPQVKDDQGNTPLDVVNIRISGVKELIHSLEAAQQEHSQQQRLLKRLKRTAEILQNRDSGKNS